MAKLYIANLDFRDHVILYRKGPGVNSVEVKGNDIHSPGLKIGGEVCLDEPEDVLRGLISSYAQYGIHDAATLYAKYDPTNPTARGFVGGFACLVYSWGVPFDLGRVKTAVKSVASWPLGSPMPTSNISN